MKEPFFTGKSILLISPESWSHLFVSKHHYAIELSKKNRVFFLNPPSGKLLISESKYENLFLVDYTPFVKGLRFFPSFFQKYIMRRKYNQIQKLAATNFDCVWSFDNSVFFDFGFLPKHVVSISHIVDYSQHFQLKKAASTATICFGVSKNIVDKLLNSNRNTFQIAHGVSMNRTTMSDLKLPGSNSIRALYAGNLDSIYMDKELINSLIRAYPQVDFFFLGSGGKNLEKFSNTFFLGAIKPLDLINYFEKADILLLLYDYNQFKEQLTNAHKILEYLLSGKVIISNYMSDYADKPFLLEMGKDRKEILKNFENVMLNLEDYNRPERVLLRKEYAVKNTYLDRIQEIEEILQQVIQNQ